jgi:hypothetical protein
LRLCGRPWNRFSAKGLEEVNRHFMGKNKHIRKVIAGQLRTIARHQRKIEEEIANPPPTPDVSESGKVKLT